MKAYGGCGGMGPLILKLASH